MIVSSCQGTTNQTLLCLQRTNARRMMEAAEPKRRSQEAYRIVH